MNIIKKISSNHKLQILVCCSVSFLIHALVMNQFISWFSTDTDGYWLHAATFLGKDWSGVARNMDYYYSWGYSLLLTIPMMLTDVPSRLCKLAVLMNAGLCALVVPIGYDIVRKLSHKASHREALLGAFVVSVYSTYILECAVSLSECLIYFLSFFVFWCLVNMNHSAKLKWAVFSGLAVGYLYIVHNRNLSIVIAFLLLAVIYGFWEKEVKKPLIMTGTVVVMWIWKLYVDNWLTVRETTAGIYTKNTYGAIADRYTKKLSFYQIISVLENIIGETWYTYIGTMLIGGLGIFYIIKQIFKYKKHKNILNAKLYLYALFSWLFSIGVSALFNAKGQVSYDGRIDKLIYGRYMENTVGILILFGFIYIIELCRNKEKKKLFWMILVMAVSGALLNFVTWLFSWNCNPRRCNWFSVVAVLIPFQKEDMKVSIVMASVILGIIGILVIICLANKRKMVIFLGYMIMSVTFIGIGYNVTSCLSKLYAEGKSIVNNPSYNEYFNDICNYIRSNNIEKLYVYTADGYEAFSYQFFNQDKVVSGITKRAELDSVDAGQPVLMKLADIPGDLSYEIAYSNGLYGICYVNTKSPQQEALDKISPKYDLDLDAVVVDLDTVEEEYSFLYVSDNQANFDSRQNLGWFGSASDRVFTDESGISAADNFDHFISFANEEDMDAVLFGGDIIDFASQQNLRTLSRKIGSLNVPYLYTYGNHDSYVPWENRFDDDNEQFLSLFQNKDCEFQCMELEGINIVSVRNYQKDGTANVSSHALQQMKQVCQEGKPVILMLHVPVYTEQSQGLNEVAAGGNGEVFRSYEAGKFGTVYQSRLMGYDCGYDLTEETKEFLDLIYNDDSPICLVLSGHLHESWSGYITDTKKEYVVDGAFKNKGIVLTVK